MNLTYKTYNFKKGSKRKTFTVIYRTGGTENFKWHRVLERFVDRASAISCKQELEQTGYKALIHDTDMLKKLGMPETYGPEIDNRYFKK